MGLQKRLKKRFKGLSELTGSALQKRRDKLSQAGIHREKQRAEFSTHVKGKEKRTGACSKPPRGL